MPTLLLLTLAIVVTTAVPSAPPQEKAGREEFSAILSNISNVGGTGITPLTIRVMRWTTDEENERLLGILRDKGQNAFLDALVDSKEVGSIATPTSLKWDFFYARQEVTEKGERRIMMITDRAMSVAERASAAQSREYPFTVLSLTLNKDGKGEGTLAQLVQLKMLGNILGIENLATGPMKLSDVKKIR